MSVEESRVALREGARGRGGRRAGGVAGPRRGGHETHRGSHRSLQYLGVLDRLFLRM